MRFPCSRRAPPCPPLELVTPISRYVFAPDAWTPCSRIRLLKVGCLGPPPPPLPPPLPLLLSSHEARPRTSRLPRWSLQPEGSGVGLRSLVVATPGPQAPGARSSPGGPSDEWQSVFLVAGYTTCVFWDNNKLVPMCCRHVSLLQKSELGDRVFPLGRVNRIGE